MEKAVEENGRGSNLMLIELCLKYMRYNLFYLFHHVDGKVHFDLLDVIVAIPSD